MFSLKNKLKTLSNRTMNLQFFPLWGKNMTQGNKIQLSTDDLIWALKHMYWALFISFLNNKRTKFLKNTALLLIIVCWSLHLTSSCNNKQTFFRVRNPLCTWWSNMSVMIEQERLYLHANTYVKIELVMVKISINKNERYWRETCERKELNSVKSILHFWRESNMREP